MNIATYLLDKQISKGKGNKTAIYYQDQKISYQNLQVLVNKTGNLLRKMGIEIENRIAILLPDCPEFITAFLGSIKIGAVPVLLNALLTTKDYLYLLNDSRAKILVTTDELYQEKIKKIRKKLTYLKKVLIIGNSQYKRLLKDSSRVLPTKVLSPDDVAFWLYSSGSTGKPKAAVHLHHDILFTTDTYAKHVLSITEKDIVFSASKLFFAYGLGNSISFPFRVGASIILLPNKPTPEKVFETIQRYKPTIFFGVPALYNAMLQVKGAEKKYNLKSLRLCISAAETLPPTIFYEWKKKFGLEMLDGIGSTELLHIFISNQPGKVKPGSSGQLVPGYEAKIVDENGKKVSPGQTGTLLIKGDGAAAYYWNQHQKTQKTMLGEWVDTGDMYQQKGEYFIKQGRSDDMIKVGGIWVSPDEIEKTLMMHPAVLECAVVEWFDERDLEKPKAFIVLKPDYSPSETLIKELQNFVKNKIARYKYPREIEFVQELPKTATGKIQRFKLRSQNKKV